jgi:transcriptional regulator with XRE-family HTH domain
MRVPSADVFFYVREYVMGDRPISDYEGLQSILSAIAQWMKRYRCARGFQDDLMNCTADEVAKMARDLKIQPTELAALARKGPNSADLLQKLLIALGVDAKGLEHEDPLVMRDLQRLCTTCGEKRQCERDLATGLSTDKFRDYCPNAFTLDALLTAKQYRRRQRRR